MAINLIYNPKALTIRPFGSTGFITIHHDFIDSIFAQTAVEDSEQKKLVALFAIMHQVASQYSEEEITLTIDDTELEQVMRFNSDRIPANVTLKLGAAEDALTIKGTGATDVEFTATIRSEIAAGGLQVLHPPFTIDDETEAKFNAAMQAIEDKKNELSQNHVGASEAACALHDTFTQAYNRLKATGNTAEFETTTRQAIAVAKDSSLQYHRGYKQILGYAVAGLLAVLSVFLPVLAPVTVGVFHLVNNRLYFFKTDSIAKVENLDSVAKEILTEKPAQDSSSLDMH